MTALARILTRWGEPLDDGEVEEIEPPPQPAKLHDSDKCLTPHPPLCDCAACGRPAVCATRSGSCSVSWCDRCMLAVLRCRGESIANNYAFLRNFEPLEFLALADAPAKIKPQSLPAMVSLTPQASREKKERKKRQRPALSCPVGHNSRRDARASAEQLGIAEDDNVAVVTHNPKERRVTSRSGAKAKAQPVATLPEQNQPCVESNISGQVRSTGKRYGTARRGAPAKGA